LQDPNPCPSTG